MFQKGRGEQTIKYKAEVLKVYPKAKWLSIQKMGAIHNGVKRISDVEHIAWKAWESAYWRSQNKEQIWPEIPLTSE